MSKSDFLLTKWDNCMAAVGAVLRNRHVQKAWEANPLYKMLDSMEDDFEEMCAAWDETAYEPERNDDGLSRSVGYALKLAFKCAAAIPLAIPALACLPVIEAVGRSEERLKKSGPKL